MNYEFLTLFQRLNMNLLNKITLVTFQAQQLKGTLSTCKLNHNFLVLCFKNKNSAYMLDGLHIYGDEHENVFSIDRIN